MRLWPAVVLLLVPARADACGLTPPIGPSGLPMVCRGEGPRFRAGLTFGGTSTAIRFGDQRDALVQAASAATFDLQPIDGLTFGVSAGASLGGRIDHLGVRHDLLPGPLGGVGIAYRVISGRGLLPFVQVSASYSIARSISRAPDQSEATFTARDWRVGLVVGKAFAGFAPFAFVRYFGAGTEWSVGGGHGKDAHRFHFGLGSAFALGERLDLLAELAFVGEKRANVGIGYAF